MKPEWPILLLLTFSVYPTEDSAGHCCQHREWFANSEENCKITKFASQGHSAVGCAILPDSQSPLSLFRRTGFVLISCSSTMTFSFQELPSRRLLCSRFIPSFTFQDPNCRSCLMFPVRSLTGLTLKIFGCGGNGGKTHGLFCGCCCCGCWTCSTPPFTF